MSEYLALAIITPKEDCHEHCKEAILSILDITKGEEGCLQFELFEGAPGNGQLYLYERFKHKEAFEFHLAQDYTKEVFKSFEGWLARDVEIAYQIQTEV